MITVLPDTYTEEINDGVATCSMLLSCGCRFTMQFYTAHVSKAVAKFGSTKNVFILILNGELKNGGCKNKTCKLK